MDKTSIITAVHSGIRIAVVTYFNWTGGKNNNGAIIVDNAGEGLVVSYVAQELMSLERPPNFLYLEHRFSDIISNNYVGPGKPNKVLKSRGRIDIALLNNNKNLKYAIEIKARRDFNYIHYIEDIKRLSLLYKKFCSSSGENKMVAGLAASIVTEKSYRSFDDAYDALEDKIKDWQTRYKTITNKFDVSSFFGLENAEAYHAVASLISIIDIGCIY